MRVLVTGASGRVGRAVAVCLAHEHTVVGLDRAPSSTATLVGDVADPVLTRAALQGIDAVVHVAALHAPHVGRAGDAAFERSNVQATRQLAEQAAAAGVRRFVFTSTTALYGDAAAPADRAAWIDEDLSPQPRTVYHRSKLAAEGVLETIAAQGGLAVTVLRMSRCFPEPAPLMAGYRLHRGIDARDVAQAHALALRHDVPGWRCFVLSAATPFVRDDVHLLRHDAPAVLRRRAPELVEAFARRGWPLPAGIDRVCDPARAIAALGWRPRHGFAELLAMFDAGSSEVLPPGWPGPAAR